MSITEKLDAINYVCRNCAQSFWMGSKCRSDIGDRRFVMNEEDRFYTCEELRRRIKKMDRVFNRTIYSEQIRQEIGRKE